jgi:hypothetical protein
METVLGAFLGAFFGGLVTIGVAIAVERLRGPQLALSIEGPADLQIARGPVKQLRSLRVKAFHEPLPSWADWWLVRLAAQQCRGEIAFLRADGTEIFDRPMTGRWTRSPEPAVVYMPTKTGTVPVLVNPTALEPAVDIYPGETEILDVVARFDEDADCYGWNDETYFVPDWRNPERKLGHSTFLIQITVTSSGRKCREYFRLCNDGPRSAFRLDKPTPAERKAVQART